MRARGIARVALPAAAAALLITSAAPAVEPPPARANPGGGPDIELVYTAPVETQLAAPDLRSPARVWLELLRGARRTIDIEEMYAVSRPGEPLEGVIDALEEAARRGVEIRFLLEQKMLRASDPPTLERLRRVPGLRLVVVDFRKVVGRDAIIHAKFLVVDSARGYLGSQNFDWRSLKHVHELGVRIGDEAIARKMQAIFDHDFAAASRIAATERADQEARAAARKQGTPPPPQVKTSPSAGPGGDGELCDDRVRLVASPPDLLPPGVGASEREIARLIGRARREVRAQVMSYSTHSHSGTAWRVIDDALRAAAARGVKVKLLVANWSTGRQPLADLRSLAAVRGVEIRVVTLPQAAKGCISYARVIHSKYSVFDGQVAWVGTSNWEGGYLDSSRNLELVMEDARVAARLRTLHQQLWTSSYAEPLRMEGDYPKPIRECPLPDRPPLPPSVH